METAVSSDGNMETAASSDDNIETDVSSDDNMESAGSSDDEIETAISSGDETESAVSSDDETESAASSDDEMSDGEWVSYSGKLADLMNESFKAAYNEIEPLENDESESAKERVMTLAQKKFRNKIAKLLIIFYGMQEEKTYDYLFEKIEKLRKKGIAFPTAVSMAVKSSASIIDDNFDKVVNASNDSDEETSSIDD